MNKLLVVFVLLVAGCTGEEPPLPPAKPLQADEAVLAALPGDGRGEHAVKVIDPVRMPGVAGRNLQVRLLLPETPGTWPLVLFSHGNFSDREKYDAVLSHWASHGFIVAATTHLDGYSMVRGIFNSLRYGQLGLIEARVADLDRLLSELPMLQRVLPLGVRIDTDAIAVTGHSFGAFTAQQFAGAAAIDPEGPSVTAPKHPIRAVVALSPPGPMFDVITPDSWRHMQGPVLMTTGTWDVNAQFWPDWELHRMSFDTSPPGKQYALVVEGADHYLGNLICRPEREVAPQHDALRLVNLTSTAFLKAYLMEDAGALAFINASDLSSLTGGFATLKRR